METSFLIFVNVIFTDLTIGVMHQTSSNAMHANIQPHINAAGIPQMNVKNL